MLSLKYLTIHSFMARPLENVKGAGCCQKTPLGVHICMHIHVSWGPAGVSSLLGGVGGHGVHWAPSQQDSFTAASLYIHLPFPPGPFS